MREIPTPTFALAQPIVSWFSRDSSGQSATTARPARGAQGTKAPFEVRWARHQDEVRAAQRLRYQVFANEMGARIPHQLKGHDIDAFDTYCEHLLVQDSESNEVIGTYRVLTPTQAIRAGGWYSATEFDLRACGLKRVQTVELGRSCVHADHRSGAVILALWRALSDFMRAGNFSAMLGCASIPMGPAHSGAGTHANPLGPAIAAQIFKNLAEYLVPVGQRAVPYCALPIQQLDDAAVAASSVQPPP